MEGIKKTGNRNSQHSGRRSDSHSAGRELGEFTATAHKVTGRGSVMFIFDEYVTCRPMNNCSTKQRWF